MYIYQPLTFNGSALEGGNFVAVWFDPDNGPVTTRQFLPIEADVIGLGDRDVRAQPKGAFWELHCTIRDIEQSDREAFLQIFDEEAGVVILTARDNATPTPATWRISCRVTGTRRVGRAWGYFIVTLRVADTAWQEDTATTDNQTAMVGSQRAFNLTNNGNRRVRPTFTIAPQSAKSDPFDNILLSARGFFYPPPNFLPAKMGAGIQGAGGGRPILNYPVDVIDNPGNVDIDHQALVVGTDRADTTEAPLTAADTTIGYDTISNGGPQSPGGLAILQQNRAVLDGAISSATATLIAYDTGANGNPPAPGGVIRIDDELIRYTRGGGSASGDLTGCTRGYANTVPATHADTSTIFAFEQISYTAGGGGAPSTLTGVVRGVGGTIALEHTVDTNIFASQVLVNGDDVRLKVNFLSVRRYVAGCMSQTGFRVWTSVTMNAYRRKTLFRAITDSVDIIAFNEGVADLPDRGFLAIFDHVTREHEVVFYTGRSIPFAAITGVLRGVWETTARSHIQSVPVNILPSEQNDDLFLPGDFERDDEGWIGSDTPTSVLRTTIQRKFGNASLEVITGANLNAGTDSPVAPAAATTEFTASFWIRRTESVVDIHLLVRDQDDNAIATSPNFATTANTWFRVSFTFTTGAGDTGVILRIVKNGSATDITFQLDGAQIEIGDTATDYGTLDGQTHSPVALYEVFAGRADSEATFLAPKSGRPAIGLHLSENGVWRWGGYGDFTLDHQSVFYDPKHTHRPASWTPFPSTPEEDNAEPLRLEFTDDSLAWVDKNKIAGKQLRKSLVIPLAGGVDDFLADIQARSDIRLRVVGTDDDGDVFEGADQQDVREATGNANFTPDDPLYALVLQGVRAAVTGNDEEDLSTTISAPFDVYQRIAILKNTKVSAIQLRLRESDPATSMRFQVAIYESHGIYPNRANMILAFDQAVGDATGALTDADGNDTFTGSELPNASFDTIEFTSSQGVIELKGPAFYWIKIETTVASASNGLVISRGAAKTGNNIMYSVFGFDRTKPAWCRVIHEHGGPVQEESFLLNAALTETGREASFTQVRTDFAKPIVVEREDALAAGRYHCTATILNTANNESIDIDWWMDTADTLVIDCEARTVTWIDGNGNSVNALAAITPSSQTDWLGLEQGVNAIEYNEDGMVDTDLTTTYRGRKV